MKYLFILYFLLIPKHFWTTKTLRSGYKRCVLGFCGVKRYSNPTPMSDKLREVLNRDPMFVNDGFDTQYKQTHPKSRVIAALLDS